MYLLVSQVMLSRHCHRLKSDHFLQVARIRVERLLHRSLPSCTTCFRVETDAELPLHVDAGLGVRSFHHRFL